MQTHHSTADVDPFYGIPLDRAMAAQRAQAKLIREGAYTFACQFDTGKVHGPERAEILPFIATIEVRYDGAWVPEAKGSSVWWLRRELDSVAQCYRRVRVTAPWGEEITLPAEVTA